MSSKKNTTNSHRAAVLLCVKNGSKFIYKQLQSIFMQDYKDVDLYIMDNGSEDDSNKIIESFMFYHKEFFIQTSKGQNNHFANSYIQLYKSIEKKYNFYAFCDQDDIWNKDHLSRAILWLKKNHSKPSLYCSRTELIDSEDISIGFSPIFKREPSFKNALVQSIAGANTMVFNKKCAMLMDHIDTKKTIISHDWLLYLLSTAADGNVFYNQEPSVLYRQHDNNAIGSNKDLLSKLKRFSIMLKGGFDGYCYVNINLLKEYGYMSEKNKKIFKLFVSCYSNKGKLKRLLSLLRSGVYRQNKIGQIALYVNFIKKIKKIYLIK